MKRYSRRDETAAYLEQLGVHGAAAEALLREAAPLRHKRRVERTLFAALSDCEGTAPADSIEEHGACEFCLARLVADRIGVGGIDDCEGQGTARMPGFRHLGTGRKHASDGGAWMAALDEAIGHHVVAGAFEVQPKVALAELGEAPAWLRSLAREALRRSVGLDPWHADLPVDFAGTAAEWAAVLNTAEELLLSPTRRSVVNEVRAALARSLRRDDLAVVITTDDAVRAGCCSDGVELAVARAFGWRDRATVAQILAARWQRDEASHVAKVITAKLSATEDS